MANSNLDSVIVSDAMQALQPELQGLYQTWVAKSNGTISGIMHVTVTFHKGAVSDIQVPRNNIRNSVFTQEVVELIKTIRLKRPATIIIDWPLAFSSD